MFAISGGMMVVRAVQWIGRLALGLGIIALVAGTLLLETAPAPAVGQMTPVDALDAARTRDLARMIQGVIARGAPTGTIILTQAEINAAFRALSRVRPGVRGASRVGGGAVTLDVAAAGQFGLWLNGRIAVAASERGLRVRALRIGRLPLPSRLAKPLLRLGLDRLVGVGTGGTLLAGVSRVAVTGDVLSAGYALRPRDAERLFARLRDRARAFAGGTDAARIAAHLRALDRAGVPGEVAPRGSLLPWLAQTVAEAAPRSGGADRGELKAALLALSLYCGGDAFSDAIGGVAGARLDGSMRGEGNRCARVTLGGRDDLKRHFVVSAGIEAARAGGAAVGMGELKELLDSNAGGSGFSFDDMAADMAGARFAQRFLTTPASDWGAVLARLRSDADILPPLDGLPRGLSDADFRARFGDVDSEAYRAQIATIARRLEAMPLYAGLPES